MDRVSWSARPPLDAPVVIAAFEGWNDAGDAASTAARYLIDRWEGEPLAAIEPEEFFDFTSTRPQVRIDDDGQREILWPTTDLYSASMPGDAGDAVIVVGVEPQLRWKTFCAELIGVARAVEARLVVVLGALLAEVPHSRDVPVVGTAYDTDVVDELGLQPSSYEGPTGIVGVLHAACRDAGLPSASLWATVPSYVPGAPSPKAALALVERAGALLGVWTPTTDLEIAAASYERQVSELVDADVETAEYVASLEQRVDEGDEEELLSPDSLVEEVERFLRERPE